MRHTTCALAFTLTILVAATDGLAQDGLDHFVDGLELLSNNKFKEAQAKFALAIEADEENHDFYLARGVARLLCEELDKAESDFNRALKLKPNWNEGRLWLSGVVDMKGDFMRSGTIYPPAQHNRPYENYVRETTRVYGQGNWMQEMARRDNYRGPDVDKAIAAQRDVVRTKFPELAQRYVARVKSTNPSIAKILETRVADNLQKRVDAGGTIEDLNRLLEARPEDPKLLKLHAAASLAQNAPALARLEYTRVLTLAGDDAESFVGRARASALMGDGPRARKDLQIAQSLNAELAEQARPTIEADLQKSAVAAAKEDLPNLLIALHESAKTSASAKDLVEQASRFLRAAHPHRLRYDETYYDALRELRLAALRAPSTAGALADLGEYLYRHAVNVRGDSVEPRATYTAFRPMSQQKLELDEAEAALDRALQTDPNSVKALTYKAACRIERQQWGDAETLLKRAIELTPDDPAVLRLFAKVLDHIAAVNAAQARGLRSPTTWEDVNYIYTRYPSQAELAQAAELDRIAQRLWSIAEHALRNAITLRRGTHEGHFFQAVYDRRRGQLESARDSLLKAVELAPERVEYRDELISILARLGDLEGALRQKLAADNLFSTTCGPLLRLTWLSIPKTKFKSARTALDLAATIDAADPRVAAYRGVLAEEREDFEAAMAWYRVSAAICEARAREEGVSPSQPAVRAKLNPQDIALFVAVHHRAAMTLMKQKRIPEAAELLKTVAAMETRVDKDRLYVPLASAMIPDAAMDATQVPPADHLAYYLAWAHFVIARDHLDAGRAGDAKKHAHQSVGYLERKPPTIDAGNRMRPVTQLASILYARACIRTGDLDQARQAAMAYGRMVPRESELQDQVDLLLDEMERADGRTYRRRP
jgi:Tfp pilus assembly protein PilF